MRGGSGMLGAAARPIATGVRRLSRRLGSRSSAGTGSTGSSPTDSRPASTTSGATSTPSTPGALTCCRSTRRSPGWRPAPCRTARWPSPSTTATQCRRDRLADPARARAAGDPVRGLRLPDRRTSGSAGTARAAPRPAPAGACGRAPGGRGRRVRHRLSHRVAPVAAPPRPRCGQARARGLAGGARGPARADRCRSLAYPTGGWTPAVRTVAAEAGYRVAITVDRGVEHRAYAAPLAAPSLRAHPDRGPAPPARRRLHDAAPARHVAPTPGTGMVTTTAVAADRSS